MHSDTSAFWVFTINVGCGYTFTWATFDVRRQEWPDWAFARRACGAAIDAAFPGAMEVASRAVAPVLVTTLGVPEQNVARQLFFMLAMMTKGPSTCNRQASGDQWWRSECPRSLEALGTTLRARGRDQDAGITATDPEPSALS